MTTPETPNPQEATETPESLSNDEYFYLASLMIQQNCPELSIKYLVKAIERSPILTEEQQNLFFEPYRQIAKKYRAALGEFKSIYDAIEVETETQAQAVQILKDDLSQQLLALCNEICTIINTQLLPNAQTPLDQAVYHLVVGDFSRFVGELSIPEAEEIEGIANDNYLAAKTIAEGSLPLGHPTRLIIDLNYSILLNDVLDTPQQALELAQVAYNSSVAAVNEITDENVKKLSKDVLQLLKDNATEWAAESLS